MRDLGFTPCRADGDAWMRVYVDTQELVSTTDYGLNVGELYYDYVLIYVDNLLVDRRIV